MQKQKENLFQDKFQMLNSQEHTEDIIWSLSDSSEYEESAVNEKFNNITNRARILKRKRKNKVHSNISNLSITVLDTSKNSKELPNIETSPILVSKKHQKGLPHSPIFLSTQTCKQQYKSTVLPTTSYHPKSPILAQNHSPKNAGRIKKKLFTQSEIQPQSTIIVKTEKSSEEFDHIPYGITDYTSRGMEENMSKAKSELVSKVKSFFDNHFSSESSSQNSQSISEIQSQRNSSKTSSEIEILTCKSQADSTNNIKSIDANQSNKNLTNYCSTNKKKKKIRYKKDGLAYRLDNLLRKRNACLSLWHHERFLAANSNFEIPKGENTVFRIQKVQFKYGCYLLEVVDLYDCNYLVLINNCYVSETLLCDTVIKVYEPFKVIQFNEDTKLLINVCRFESSQYKA